MLPNAKRMISLLQRRFQTRLLAAAIIAAPSVFGARAAWAQTRRSMDAVPSIAAADPSGDPTRVSSAPSRTKKKMAGRKPAARVTGSGDWASTRGPAALSSRLANALESHTRSGHWGAIVVSLSHGDTLFAQNADAMMQPASTMKMFTAAVSLDRLGPDYSFSTAVLRDGPVSSDGTLNGNLYLRGSGDPSLTPRFWHDAEPMDVLAKQIAAAGIKHVKGDVFGDASAFDDKLIPDGWKTSYLGAAYAARVSPLLLNEGLVWVVVSPNGSVTLDPASTTIPIQGSVRVVGGGGGSISAARRPDGSILVRGSIGSHSAPRRYSLVVDNPALYTIGALRASMEKAGITVDGGTKLAPTPPSATEVTAIASPPLGQIIGEMDRESINVFAELLFRSAAHYALKETGSAESGLANLRDFLQKRVGASGSWVNVSDGSGLSTLDLVTPRAMVQLLGYVHQADWGPVFHASLPVEGESGTLKRRGKGEPARGNLHAKTGTTNTVAALGGYVTARDGEILAFSFIYNGGDRWNAKAAMDQMGATMAEFERQ